MIQQIIGFQGKIHFNSDKPDGPPRKLLDVSLLKSMGWVPKISISEGLAATYQWLLENQNTLLKKHK
jgi:GDP-L-fucose synthase